MKRIAQILSGLALVGTLGPPCFYFADRLELGAMQGWLLAAAVVWFAATPFWMEHRAKD